MARGKRGLTTEEQIAKIDELNASKEEELKALKVQRK